MLGPCFPTYGRPHLDGVEMWVRRHRSRARPQPLVDDMNLTQKQREEARDRTKGSTNSPANRHICEAWRSRMKGLSWIAPRRSPVRARLAPPHRQAVQDEARLSAGSFFGDQSGFSQV
jgi:hypothetical protein